MNQDDNNPTNESPSQAGGLPRPSQDKEVARHPGPSRLSAPRGGAVEYAVPSSMGTRGPLDVSPVAQLCDQTVGEIGNVVFGSKDSVRFALNAMLARGHVLLEGVPGVGKTFLAAALSRVLGLDMARVQCTPDLMPGDIVGASIFDFNSQSFSLVKGPIFTEFLLADEINRMPPKTQAAMLEAMQEKRVTIDGKHHELPASFFVMATQNPVEQEGTYPLPEAQLDRFLFKLVVGYPSERQEVHAVLAHGPRASQRAEGVDRLPVLLDATKLERMREICEQVHVEEAIASYIVSLTRATRSHRSLAVGISPRASVLLSRAARIEAAFSGRNYVVPDDVKAVFPNLSSHRVIRKPTAEMEGIRVQDIVDDVLKTTAVPR